MLRSRILAVAVVVAAAACSSDPPTAPPMSESADTSVPVANPSSAEPRLTYTDPGGRFSVSFSGASEPLVSSEPQTPGFTTTQIASKGRLGTESVRVSVASVDLALNDVAVSVDGTGRRLAANVGGRLSDEWTTKVVGHEGRGFTITHGSKSLHGATVAIGVTRFDFSVSSPRPNLDAIVDSFRLLHPISATPREFFDTAQRRCTAASEADTLLAESTIDIRQQITAQLTRRKADLIALRSTPAATDELADAVAYLDALGRGSHGQEEFLEALESDDALVSEVAARLGADLSFAADIALRRGATACG